MIKFFRSIRRKLLTENKLSNYLVYSIGEIILVVIGILIALQVNEWNNERNRRQSEAALIDQLKSDLLTSEEELLNIQDIFLERAQASAFVLRAYWMDEIPEDLEDQIWIPMSNRIYSPVLGTARSLINSGNLELISSSELRNELISYVEKVDYRLKDISRYEETYYRTGVQIVREERLGSNRSIDEINSWLTDHSERYDYSFSHELGVNAYPSQVDRISFSMSLEENLQNERLFQAYSALLISHRNIYFRYCNILENTYEMLDLLDEISGVSSLDTTKLQAVDFTVPLDSIDWKIIHHADALLADNANWNRVDDQICDDDHENNQYSLFCALHQASVAATGTYDWQQPALLLVKEVLKDYNNRRAVAHHIINWNDHPDTSFEEVKAVLADARAVIEQNLK